MPTVKHPETIHVRGGFSAKGVGSLSIVPKNPALNGTKTSSECNNQEQFGDEQSNYGHVLFRTFSGHSSGIVHSREQLIALCRPVLLPGARHDIPEELRTLKRGCRAGTKWKTKKKRRYKPSIPAIIMGNVRALGNKMDELGVLTKTQWQ
ncbi:putative ABC transporter permease protein YqgI [Dissostichus eleginoides]|uniref:ABC transporter permease protein YqgI n=1 Tax=Dissostichus eleginoides TaxID=100907 RepID=A0AAD9FPH5_DISEL|nr:putative ABC transporter permease protein YqgI [Dissostichus eleginoides]